MTETVTLPPAAQRLVQDMTKHTVDRLYDQLGVQVMLMPTAGLGTIMAINACATLAVMSIGFGARSAHDEGHDYEELFQSGLEQLQLAVATVAPKVLDQLRRELGARR